MGRKRRLREWGGEGRGVEEGMGKKEGKRREVGGERRRKGDRREGGGEADRKDHISRLYSSQATKSTTKSGMIVSGFLDHKPDSVF